MANLPKETPTLFFPKRKKKQKILLIIFRAMPTTAPYPFPGIGTPTHEEIDRNVKTLPPLDVVGNEEN